MKYAVLLMMIAGLSVGTVNAAKWWRVDKHIEKGAKTVAKETKKAAKKVGEGVKKGFEETKKGVEKAANKIAEGTGKAWHEVKKTGIKVGDAFIKAGEKTGEFFVKVGKEAKKIPLKVGASFQKLGDVFVNIGGKVKKFSQQTVNRVTACSKMVYFGARYAAATALEEAVKAVGGAIEKLFMIKKIRIKGSTAELIREGETPKVTIEGTVAGQKIKWKDIHFNLKDPAKNIERIIDKIIDEIAS